MVVKLANVEMVLSNLSCPQRGYGNMAVTVSRHTAVHVLVVVCFVVVVVVVMIAVTVAE